MIVNNRPQTHHSKWMAHTLKDEEDDKNYNQGHMVAWSAYIIVYAV